MTTKAFDDQIINEDELETVQGGFLVPFLPFLGDPPKLPTGREKYPGPFFDGFP